MVKGKLAKICAAIALAGAVCPHAWAGSSNGGTSALPFLRYDFGPRQTALAGAATALDNGPYSLRYNPAGLGRMKNAEIAAMTQSGVLDTKMQALAGAIPLPLKGFLSGGPAAMGANLLFSGNGDIDWYATNSDGSARQSGVSRSAGKDMVFSLGYGEQVGSTPSVFGRHAMTHYAGAAVKLISSSLPNTDGSDVSAKTFAVDAGYSGTIPDFNLDMAVAVNNIGPSIKYVDEANPLPATVRGALAYHVNPGTKTGFTFSADLLRHMKDEANALRLGTEIAIERFVFLRLGYRALEDVSGLNFGFGLQWMGFQFDFAAALNSELGNITQFGLAYRFGGEEKTSASKSYSRRRQTQPASDAFLDMNESGRRQDNRSERRPASKASDRGTKRAGEKENTGANKNMILLY